MVSDHLLPSLFLLCKECQGSFLTFPDANKWFIQQGSWLQPKTISQVWVQRKNDFSALTPDPPFHFFFQLIKFALTKHHHSKAGRLFKAFVFLNASNSERQTLYLYYQVIKFAFPCI